jgi:hypothetical protein
MKFIFRALFLLMVPAMMTGCNPGPIESLTFTSPDGDRTIKVTGTRSTSLAPIMAQVTLIVPKGEKDFSFEHQASSLTKDNVTATWANNNNCRLTFMLDDGESWEVDCFLLDDRVEAVKNFKVGGTSIFD